MGGWTGGIKGKYSCGMHIGQRNPMPSYWVQHKIHMPATKIHWARTAKENKPNQNLHSTGKIQWPCSSLWIDVKHRREFHSAICGSILQISVSDSLCVTSTVDLQRYYF